MSNSIKSFIPNSITCLNLLSGSIAIVLAIQGNVLAAGYLILLATVFDFFDGFVARKLNVMSELGKQLDSLADLVSFGMAPTAIIYESLRYSQKIPVGAHFLQLSTLNTIILGMSFIIVIFSALRLAKFNISTNQKYSFVGLPTPAFAILIASFPIIRTFEPDNFFVLNLIYDLLGMELPMVTVIALIGLQFYVLEQTYFLIPVIIIFSFLLISNINMFAMKFKNFTYKDNKIRYNFLIYSLILILFLQSVAIPIIIFSYVIVSIIKQKSLKAANNLE